MSHTLFGYKGILVVTKMACTLGWQGPHSECTGEHRRAKSSRHFGWGCDYYIIISSGPDPRSRGMMMSTCIQLAAAFTQCGQYMPSRVSSLPNVYLEHSDAIKGTGPRLRSARRRYESAAFSSEV